MSAHEVAELLRQAAADDRTLDVRGHGTFGDRLGSRPDDATVLEMSEHRGVLHHVPADLTVTVAANTAVAELTEALRAHGQECALDIWGAEPGTGTVAGRVAAGLAGRRALARGAVRDAVLGIGFVTGDGVAAHAGGATVKNVTGYDLVRLLVGSWGTLAVFTEITLKVAPVPAHSEWYVAEDAAVGALWQPSAVVRRDGLTHVLLEGDPRDCRDQARSAGLRPGPAPEVRSEVRVAVPPRFIDRFADVPGAVLEPLLGIVHLPDGVDVADLRARAEPSGGRVLDLSPEAGRDPFRDQEPSAFQHRLKRSFDPDGVLAPWRHP